MSAGPLFPLIPEDELRLVPEPMEFEPLLAEELPPADSDLEELGAGLEDSLAATSSTQSDIEATIPDLADAIAVVPEFVVDVEGPVLEELGAAIAAGDEELGQVQTVLGVDLGEPLEPAPLPPGEEGGGSGGGGGTATPPILEPPPPIEPLPGQIPVEGEL